MLSQENTVSTPNFELTHSSQQQSFSLTDAKPKQTMDSGGPSQNSPLPAFLCCAISDFRIVFLTFAKSA
jgi:hypothetical protein